VGRVVGHVGGGGWFWGSGHCGESLVEVVVVAAASIPRAIKSLMAAE